MNRIELQNELKELQPNEQLIDSLGNPILYLYTLGNGKTVISASKPDGICNTCKGVVFNTERTHLTDNYYCGVCNTKKEYTQILLKRF